MLEPHEERPKLVLRGDRRMTVFQPRMMLDQPTDGAIDIPPVLNDLLDFWPRVLDRKQVVPGHFVDAGLKQHLEIRANGLDEPGDPELVDIEDRRMSVIEDERVTQTVVRGRVEGVAGLEAGKEEIGEGPGVLEIVQVPAGGYNF